MTGPDDRPAHGEEANTGEEARPDKEAPLDKAPYPGTGAHPSTPAPSPTGSPIPVPSRSMPQTSPTCEVCGTVMYDRHCKIACPNCGYLCDCSDP